MSTAKGKKGTRNYGKGSIYPKPNGKGFIGEIFVVINGEKKRKKVSGKTKTDVRIKLRELQNNAEAGLLDTKPEEKDHEPGADDLRQHQERADVEPYPSRSRKIHDDIL